jgi:hypothetical protein
MKKTIIAAAIAAVVSAPAMADVKISGQINQEFKDASGSDLASGNNADVVISGSEDLGNGMKASFKIHRFYDDNSGSGTNDNDKSADQSIGLSGDFGSVTVGRFEPYTVSSISSMMNIDAAEDLDLETTTTSQQRSEGGIRYVAPTMNGLTVGVEGFADGSAAGDDFGTTTIFAQYSNGPLLVRVAQETNGGATAATADEDVTSIAASYSMDGLKATVVQIQDDNGSSADQDTTVYGVSYTMGANTIAVATTDSDVTATDGDSIISLKHALSKSTSVYLVRKNEDQAGANDTTLLGVKHSF